MAYRKPDFTTEFMVPQQQPPQQGWVDFGEDQPIDFAPAVNAFQQRFMNGAKAAPAHEVNPEHANAAMPSVPMEHSNMPTASGVHDAPPLASKSPIKSL